MVRIDIVSSNVVRMANTAASMSRMELTPWDLQMLLLDPIQKGILFHKPKSEHLQKTLIHRLRNSLSRTLNFFPPLAGRLATTRAHDNTVSFFVECNNTGVEFVHAVAAAVSVSDILEPTYIPKIVSSLFALNEILNCEGVSKPLLGVQVTELEDGLFIACTANHAVMDGISFWHFFNSWSELTRGLDTVTKTPVFERSFHPVRLPPLEQNMVQKFVPPPLLERVFHFSKEILAKLKAKANYEGGTNKISSLQALLAHLWWSVTRCRHSSQSIHDLKDGFSQQANFMMTVGGRTRVPLPDGYFGNALRPATITISEAELLQKGFSYAARVINELVAQQTSEAVIKFVEDWMKNPILHRKGNSSFSFVISSSPRHDVYGNDFGWGKPMAVRSGKGQKSDGKITVYPAAVAGGTDVEFCLAPEILQALGEDPEFMEAFTL